MQMDPLYNLSLLTGVWFFTVKDFSLLALLQLRKRFLEYLIPQLMKSDQVKPVYYATKPPLQLLPIYRRLIVHS